MTQITGIALGMGINSLSLLCVVWRGWRLQSKVDDKIVNYIDRIRDAAAADHDRLLASCSGLDQKINALAFMTCDGGDCMVSGLRALHGITGSV